MTDRLLTELRDVFRSVFNSPGMELHPDQALSTMEDCDSLKRLELIVSVESAFQVRFTTAEAAELDEISGFLDLLRSKLH
ncbi:MAG: phosphopantetheine-binding protein [Acidobacteriota bacterium]